MDSSTFKVGDVEKEKEIERRLRELGLWENKRRLESHVASMLEAQIDEKDALSRTLKNCRRKRGDGKTAIDEIRNIISPRIIRDCYGQKIAYHVNILMGCFTKDVRYDLVDDVVVICGSTAAQDDSTRLTKEIRLELPPSLNMAALTVSYAAGAVKIRVPYLMQIPAKSSGSSSERGGSESRNSRPYKFSSISPIYSLSMQLNSRRRGPGSSEGVDSPATGSDSPSVNGETPGGDGSVESEARSLSDPLSPYPVFDENEEDEEVRKTQLNGFIPSNGSAEDSDHISLDLDSAAVPVEPANDRTMLSTDCVNPSDETLLLSNGIGLPHLSPSGKDEFDRLDYNGNTESATKLCSNQTSNAISPLDSVANNYSNAVLSSVSLKETDRPTDHKPINNNSVDLRTPTLCSKSPQDSVLNRETVVKSVHNGIEHSRFGPTDVFNARDLGRILGNGRGSGAVTSSRDSGIFSCNGAQSLTDENFDDQDITTIESDYRSIDSIHSKTDTTNRSQVSGRNSRHPVKEESFMMDFVNGHDRTFSHSERISSEEKHENHVMVSDSEQHSDFGNDLSEHAETLQNGFDRLPTVKSSYSKVSSVSNGVGRPTSKHLNRLSNGLLNSADDGHSLPMNELLENRVTSTVVGIEAEVNGGKGAPETWMPTDHRHFQAPSSDESVSDKELPFESPVQSYCGVDVKNSAAAINGAGNRGKLLQRSPTGDQRASSEMSQTKSNHSSAGDVDQRLNGTTRFGPHKEVVRIGNGVTLHDSGILAKRLDEGHHRTDGVTESLSDCQPSDDKVTAAETNRSTGSDSNITKKKKRTRPVANLNFILDSLDETFL